MADRNNDRIAEERLAGIVIIARAETLVLIENGRTGLEFETRNLFVLVDEERLGTETVHDLDVALQGFLDFMLPGRHLLALFQADQGDILGALALGRQGHVDGHVAAADDDHILADLDRLAHGRIAQEINTLQDALGILVFHTQAAAAMQTDGHEAGFETLFLKAFKGHILAEGHAALDLHAHLADHVDLGGQYIARQAVFGDAHAHHAARFRQLFENRDRIALERQGIGRRHAGRPRADHGDLFSAARLLYLGNVGFAALAFIIGQEAVQFADRQGLIHVVARALALTRMMAHAAANAGEGMFLLEQLQALPCSGRH